MASREDHEKARWNEGMANCRFSDRSCPRQSATA